MMAILLISWILTWVHIIRALLRAPGEEELWKTGTQADEPDNNPQI